MHRMNGAGVRIRTTQLSSIHRSFAISFAFAFSFSERASRHWRRASAGGNKAATHSLSRANCPFERERFPSSSKGGAQRDENEDEEEEEEEKEEERAHLRW